MILFVVSCSRFAPPERLGCGASFATARGAGARPGHVFIEPHWPGLIAKWKTWAAKIRGRLVVPAGYSFNPMALRSI